MTGEPGAHVAQNGSGVLMDRSDESGWAEHYTLRSLAESCLGAALHTIEPQHPSLCNNGWFSTDRCHQHTDTVSIATKVEAAW